MAIGRTFQESLQKALRSMETGLTGLNEIEIKGAPDKPAIVGALSRPTPDRLLMIAQAFRLGLSVDEVAHACNYDPWFLRQIEELVDDRGGGAGQGPAQGRRRPAATSRRRASPTRAWPSSPGQSAADVARHAAQPRRPAGVQAHRHLRRRVRIAHALSLFLLRGRRRAAGRVRGPADRPPQGHHPGRRPQPHRPGHRVRLLLRPRRLRPARGGLRDHHGQLQSRDRLDRLRHLRPALFRAADRRGRARAGRGRAAQRRAAGRDRAVRRPDAAQARQAARGGGHSDPRHLARRHRSRRGSRALPEAAPQARSCASPTTARRRRRKRRSPSPRRSATRW